ncbi:cytochrome P450 [Crepidotus variabilis]|uniref:Cytochrome P450 n=1 Tax=Crepidotus variabilis TaxID=179855 RepID=A0A9P6JWQ6_9AGAR|nr:cytochrome P450 [Crepidotus variabilis]
MSLLSSVLSVTLLATLCLIFKWRKAHSVVTQRRLYPPGPTTRSWIFGNAGDISVETQCDRYTEWYRKYGDVTYFRIFKEHFILVSSHEAAVEFFEKRSKNYSTRPFSMMAQLMGWNFPTSFKPYGEQWRAERRLLQHHFKPDAMPSYHAIQTRQVNIMLQRLLTEPDEFRNHIRNLAGAIIMSTVYGYDIAPKDDPYVKIAETATSKLGEAMFPGASPVNVLPFLRYFPDWFPGCGFHQSARDTKVVIDAMLNEPIASVQERIKRGINDPCIASQLLSNQDVSIESQVVKNVCSTIYAAGYDTTISAVATFFYAMANFHDVQLKAQTEIESVIGTDRLPSFDDRATLPYVEALFRELLRWQPVVPFSLFHAASEEDAYNGYHIPKGATIIPNIRAMTRDPSRYMEPEIFNPSRFLKLDGTLNDDDVQYVFGFGRRICPGRYFASDTVWLSIVRVLFLFDIQRKKDAFGNYTALDSGYGTGLVAHPLPFECTISPRPRIDKQIILDSIAEEL